jgi:hypothetical protein
MKQHYILPLDSYFKLKVALGNLYEFGFDFQHLSNLPGKSKLFPKEVKLKPHGGCRNPENYEGSTY